MSNSTLYIDTSLNGAAVAITTSDQASPAYFQVTANVTDSARQLPIMVDDAVKVIGINLREVSRIKVSVGPGSFTGIRVGLAFCYGITEAVSAISGQIAVASVSSLGLLAQKLSNKENPAIVMLPSTKTHGYLASLKGTETYLAPIDIDFDPTSLQGAKKVFVLGDWPQMQRALNNSMGIEPHLLSLKSSAEQALQCMIDDDSPYSANFFPRPLYLRKSSVEEKIVHHR